MLAHSPKDRSRSPHRTNGTNVIQTNSSSSSSSSSSKHLSSTTINSPNQNDSSSQIETNNDNANNNNNNNNHNSIKTKKENESQLRMKNLKSFIQTLINDTSTLGSTYDEQVKALENACIKEFHDLSLDRIRRMIRSMFKGRKSLHTTNSFLHQDHSNILPTTTDRFNSNENNTKKNRSNSTSNSSTTKPSDLITPSASTLSALDADFLRHAFSQQFRPQLDLSAYFSAAAASNGNGPTSSLFRPNFSPSNFLQSLTTPPPSLSTTSTSSHTHTNGSYQRTNDSSTSVNKLLKPMKLSNNESNSIKVLINAYREAASYLNRSADELEQLI